MAFYKHHIGSITFFIFWTISCVSTNQFVDDENKPMYCFQCNSGLDPDCLNVQPNNTDSYHYKPCLDTEKYNGSQPFCRKIVQMIFARENLRRVVRKCGWVRHKQQDCYSIVNEDHMETICQCFTRGCNGAPLLSALNSLTALVFVHTIYMHLI